MMLFDSTLFLSSSARFLKALSCIILDKKMEMINERNA
jgi:hypothetical protein